MNKTYVSLSLLVLTLMVYLQVFKFGFVNLDDRVALLDNPHFRGGISLAGLVFGFDAGWRHPIDVTIHAASSLPVLAIFRRMTAQIWESAFVTFVFALCPLLDWWPLELEKGGR